MSYEAHVTDTAYCYDGSFAGFLCCVFESYARKEIPAEVCPPEEGQLNFFGTRQIFTDEQHARRVAAGLDRLGREVKDRVTTGFLCTDPGKDLTLLRFVRLCFAQGPRAAQMLGDPDAAAAFALERAVDNEVCRLIEFIRFEERDGMLGAVIHPKHRILPLLRGHFCSRLPDESFLIYDAAHGTALLHRDGQVRYLAMERYIPGTDETELDWQRMWKRFFKALTIEQRRDEKRVANDASPVDNGIAQKPLKADEQIDPSAKRGKSQKQTSSGAVKIHREEGSNFRSVVPFASRPHLRPRALTFLHKPLPQHSFVKAFTYYTSDLVALRKNNEAITCRNSDFTFSW